MGQPKRTLRLAGLGLTGLGLGGLGAAALGPPIWAQAAGSTTWKFEGKLGAEYNSNVAVSDLDTNTGQGDWAATINLNAEVIYKPTGKAMLRGGYDFSQSLYQEFDAFNLAIHRGYAEAAYDFDAATVGVLGNYAQANLDGDKYLTYQQVSPYVSKQFGDAVFLRGAYAYTDKTFKGRADRDAKSNALQADAYFFLDGVSRYITVGVKGTKEDATGPEFDYKSGTYKARFTQRFNAFNDELTFRAGVEYEDRDYDNVTPSISAVRKDKRTVADAVLEIPLGKHAFSEVSYRYGKYDSNLPSADYNEQVGAIRIGLRY